jgi:hypothetical protein
MDIATRSALRVDFRAGLWLPDWDDYSVWGYDTAGSYFAQLYRNHIDDPDAIPHIWLDGHHPIITSEDELARTIAATTGTTLDDVATALHPEPRGHDG